MPVGTTGAGGGGLEPPNFKGRGAELLKMIFESWSKYTF